MTVPFLNATHARLVRFAVAALLVATAAEPALSANVSLSGNLAQDNSVQFFTLTLGGTGAITVNSISYAGGTDLYGNTVAAGGFDPALYLFSSTGALLSQSDDGVSVPVDPASGLAADAAFTSGALTAGDYTLALVQSDNLALGFDLSDGFTHAGNANFSAAFGCSNGTFCDYGGNNRTSAWTINFSGPTLTAVVPEPGSLGLVLAAGGALVALRRPRQSGCGRIRRPALAAG